MAENSGMRVLEDGQVRASDPHPLLAAMAAARDGAAPIGGPSNRDREMRRRGRGL